MSPAEADVYSFLETNGIVFEKAEHERVSTIEECRISMEMLGAVMPKNLLLCPRNKSCYYLLLMHPLSVFSTSSVSRQAGSSRLSFADDEALGKLMHTHSGALSPFGFIYASAAEVKLLIDEKLLTEPSLVFHPLENTASVRITAHDFTDRFLTVCSMNIP